MKRALPILAALWLILWVLPAAGQWTGSDYYRGMNGFEPGDNVDDAAKGINQVIVAQLFDPAFGTAGVTMAKSLGLPILGEDYAQIDDNPIEGYLRRWQWQRNDGRAASEFCAGLTRFLQTVPAAPDAIDKYYELVRAGRFGITPEEIAKLNAVPERRFDLIADKTLNPTFRQIARELDRFYLSYDGLADWEPLSDSCASGRLVIDASRDAPDGICAPVARPMGFRPNVVLTSRLFVALEEAGVEDFDLNCVPIAINVQGVEIDRLTIRNAWIYDLRLDDSDISGLWIENSRSDDFLQFSRSRFTQDVRLYNIQVEGIDFQDARFDLGFSVFQSQIGVDQGPDYRVWENRRAQFMSFVNAVSLAPASITQTTVKGDVYLTAMTGTSLSVRDTYVDGNVLLGRGEFSSAVELGLTGEGITVRGGVYARSLRAFNLVMEDGLIGVGVGLNEAVIPQIIIGTSVVGGGLNLGEITADRLNVYRTTASSMNLTRSVIARILSLSIRAKFVSAFALEAGSVLINYTGRDEYMSRTDWSNRPLPARCVDPTMLPLIVDETQSNWAASGWPLADKVGCLQELGMDSAQVEGDFVLEGNLLTVADFGSAKIGGSLSLAGQSARYGKNSCVTGRGLRTDTIIVDPDGVGVPRGDGYAPDFIDLYGAQFRMIRPSDSELATADRTGLGQAYLSLFTDPGGFWCGSLSGPQKQEGTAPQYQPAIFDALADGFENSGDVDLARSIMIRKNYAYASSLRGPADPWSLEGMLWAASTFTTQVVYGLAGAFTGFGYDNIRTFYWLAGIIAFGSLLGWIEKNLRDPGPVWTGANRMLTRRRAPKEAALPAKRRSTRRKTAAVPKAPTVARSTEMPAKRERRHFFLSLDRAIPSLSLDNAFGSYQNTEMAWWLQTYYYWQRVVCFVIIGFTIAGAFNVFQ